MLLLYFFFYYEKVSSEPAWVARYYSIQPSFVFHDVANLYTLGTDQSNVSYILVLCWIYNTFSLYFIASIFIFDMLKWVQKVIQKCIRLTSVRFLFFTQTLIYRSVWQLSKEYAADSLVSNILWQGHRLNSHRGLCRINECELL